MMYNEKLVAVVKANGRVLRETNGTVHIPFGTEYSIQIKNLHTEKAVVSIDIDGDNVTDGSRYIIPPNETVEVEGFLKGNAVTRKFKFIEKTEEISDFRGDGMEDGLVKFTYQFEKKWEPPKWIYNTNEGDIWMANNDPDSSGNNHKKGMTRSVSYTSNNVYSTQVGSAVSCSLDSFAVASAAVPNDAGITGRGSRSNQTFGNGHVWQLEDAVHTMVIQLKGGVRQPIYTKTRLQCDLCGRKWPSTHERCGSCGNALID